MKNTPKGDKAIFYMIPNLKNYTLQGKYYKQNSKLVGENLILTICERKKPTPKKPPKYLIGKIINTKESAYISSLYICPPCGGYKIEYRGLEYAVTKGENPNEILIQFSNS